MRNGRAVTLHDPNVFDPSPQFISNHLGECRLKPLTVRGRTETAGNCPSRIEAECRRFRSSVDWHARRSRDARPDAGQFRIGGYADTKSLPAARAFDCTSRSFW